MLINIILNKQNPKLIIIAGQSNSAGIAFPTGNPTGNTLIMPLIYQPTLSIPNPNIKIWNYNTMIWETMTPGTNLGLIDAPGRYGFGLSLLTALQKKYGKVYALILGQSSTGLANGSSSPCWNPNVHNQLYDKLILNLTNLEVEKFNILGFFWSQWEQDAASGNSSSYLTNCTNFYASIRSIIGNVNIFYNEAYINSGYGTTATNIIRNAHTSLNVGKNYMVPADDLTYHTDNVHFNAQGYIDLGNRFYDKMFNLTH